MITMSNNFNKKTPFLFWSNHTMSTNNKKKENILQIKYEKSPTILKYRNYKKNIYDEKTV